MSTLVIKIKPITKRTSFNNTSIIGFHCTMSNYMNYQFIRADLSFSVELVHPHGVHINIDKILTAVIQTVLIVFQKSNILFRTPNYSNQFRKKERYNLKGRLSYRTLKIKLWS